MNNRRVLNTFAYYKENCERYEIYFWRLCYILHFHYVYVCEINNVIFYHRNYTIVVYIYAGY